MNIHFLCNDGSPIDVVWSDIYGRGVGGAELALLSLTETLAAKGHKVTVYNQTAHSRSEQGIQFSKQDEFNKDDGNRILIIFRSPNQRALGANAKRLFWWSTDQFTVGDFKALGNMVDFIVTISPYHTAYHMRTYGFRGDKIQHIDLGVRDEYEEQPEKVKNRLIFCSIADRGLVYLNGIWPSIRGAVPDATLSITSDYRLWGNLSPGDHKHRLMWAHLPGIQYHGCVPRATLVQLQSQAEIMAYSCTYEELFCVSVAECEVSGAYPVTSSMGALETTNQYGTIIAGIPGRTDFTGNFASRIISLLTDERDYLEKQQKRMMKEARERFSWNKIADTWLHLFEEGKLP